MAKETEWSNQLKYWIVCPYRAEKEMRIWKPQRPSSAKFVMANYLLGKWRSHFGFSTLKDKKLKPVSCLALCPLLLFFFSITFTSLFCFSLSFPSFRFLNAIAVCLFTQVHSLEFAWNLVRVSALCLALEEVSGCSRTVTLACCFLLICRVKLFKIKILLPLNFSIWGFPRSFPEADGASWSCACRALHFLQCCLLPMNPAGCVLPSELPGSRKACVQAVVLFCCQPGQRWWIAYSLTRKQPGHRCWWQGWKDTFWVKKFPFPSTYPAERSVGCAEKCNSNQFNWSRKEAACLQIGALPFATDFMMQWFVCSRALWKVQENMQ